MKSIFKFAITLGLVGMICGLSLAIVWRITSPLIALQEARALEEGLKTVFPGDVSFEKLEEQVKANDQSVSISESFLVKSGNDTVGMVLTVTVPGSQAPIKLIVGVKKDGVVSGVQILSHQETAGLGANADNPSYYVDKKNKVTFTGQFSGKSLNKDAFEVKKDVISITGATITSRAISNAVKQAGNAALDYLSGRKP